MSGMWVDDPAFEVSASSSCSAYESDGIVTAGIDDARCDSCFFHVGSGCHNAFTSGLKMASIGIKVSERMCPECVYGDSDGCMVALGDYTVEASHEQEVEIERYAVSSATGVCPGFERVITASVDDDDYLDLDTALFLGGF